LTNIGTGPFSYIQGVIRKSNNHLHHSETSFHTKLPIVSRRLQNLAKRSVRHGEYFDQTFGWKLAYWSTLYAVVKLTSQAQSTLHAVSLYCTDRWEETASVVDNRRNVAGELK